MVVPSERNAPSWLSGVPSGSVLDIVIRLATPSPSRLRSKSRVVSMVACGIGWGAALGAGAGVGLTDAGVVENDTSCSSGPYLVCISAICVLAASRIYCSAVPLLNMV